MCRKVTFCSVFLVKVTTTPALPEDFYLRHLLKADVYISTKVTPRWGNSCRYNSKWLILYNTAHN